MMSNVSDKLQNRSISEKGGKEEKDVCDKCVNCGKEEGSGSCEGVAPTTTLKKCTACKMVKYCNRDCQIAHRARHKKECKKRAAEIYDETLFKDHPPLTEDCPICQIPLPLDKCQISFNSCCGQSICAGCTHAILKEEIKQGKDMDDLGMCAFCRVIVAETVEEMTKRIQIQVEKGNAGATSVLARYYAQGENGFPIDHVKSGELLLKAGELGDASAYYNLGNLYYYGRGVRMDVKKAKHYYGLGAMQGNLNARTNLAKIEGYAFNDERAYKHFLIGARGGDEECLSRVRMGISLGLVTKEEYGDALRAYKQRQDEVRSDMRDEVLVYQANPMLYAEIDPLSTLT